jgi:glycosyltransferase involved in cell wall biosynthesis
VEPIDEQYLGEATLKQSSLQVSIIVPTYNSLPFVEAASESIEEAMDRFPSSEVIYCDNGSNDGTLEYLAALKGQRIRLVSRPEATIGAVRNAGARIASGKYLLFIDSDCTIPDDYLIRLSDSLVRTGAASIGCRVYLPRDAHWIPKVWHSMHFPASSSNVKWLNSANVCVSREAFVAVGGFSESIETGEDAELGLKLNAHGYRQYQDLSLAVLHHRNPGSLTGFCRKEYWRGLGMFGTVGYGGMNKPVIFTVLHGLSSSAAFLILLTGDYPVALAASVALLLAVPTLAVSYRVIQQRRIVAFPLAVLLYFLYFSSRFVAMVRISLSSAWRKKRPTRD